MSRQTVQLLRVFCQIDDHVSMIASPSNISSDASLTASQHDILPFPEKLPVTSAPLSARKAGKTAAFLSPSAP